MSRINWSKALADYLKDETQSYASIAKKYGVSKQSVVKRAVKERWQVLRRKTLREVGQKLTEIVGEDIAVVNARHAQIGKVLQAAALKAIKEKDFKPENFMQALRAIVEGVKIERETLDMDEPRGLQGIFNTPEMARKYSIKEQVAQNYKPLVATAPVNKPPGQISSSKPQIDPKLLEQIQERALQLEKATAQLAEKASQLKENLEVKQAEADSLSSRSGWS